MNGNCQPPYDPPSEFNTFTVGDHVEIYRTVDRSRPHHELRRVASPRPGVVEVVDGSEVLIRYGDGTTAREGCGFVRKVGTDGSTW